MRYYRVNVITGGQMTATFMAKFESDEQAKEMAEAAYKNDYTEVHVYPVQLKTEVPVSPVVVDSYLMKKPESGETVRVVKMSDGTIREIRR